ncbi:hypothetical protein A5764_17900 [Mycobacterium sp. 852002-51057_SCH5723018]|nr:hypothetical protein A5764_17900 [Mycobacterium sp. 852002-51057_SCH5723018]
MAGQAAPVPSAPGTSNIGPSSAPQVPLPGAGERVVFERNVKPLFRQHDRESGSSLQTGTR